MSSRMPWAPVLDIQDALNKAQSLHEAFWMALQDVDLEHSQNNALHALCNVVGEHLRTVDGMLDEYRAQTWPSVTPAAPETP